MTNFAISLNNVTVSYHDRPVLRGVSADIPPKTITGIVGPNGAGKSTLLKTMLGLTPRDTGEVLIFGKNIEEYRHKVAYIPQKEQIDWDFPVVVEEIVMMGRYPILGWFGKPKTLDHQLVKNALRDLGMESFAKRHIRLLSGGQQQRVFIARALVQEAEILLMDEPFAGVDAATQNSILELIEKLKNEGKTIVIINHDLNLCKRFDILMLINKQLVAIGAPNKVYTEENLRRTYGGQMVLIDQAEILLQEAKK